MLAVAAVILVHRLLFVPHHNPERIALFLMAQQLVERDSMRSKHVIV
jgi:hypothetical protein